MKPNTRVKVIFNKDKQLTGTVIGYHLRQTNILIDPLLVHTDEYYIILLDTPFTTASGETWKAILAHSKQLTII